MWRGWNRSGWGKARGVDEEEERVSGCGGDGTGVGGGRREGWMRKRRG